MHELSDPTGAPRVEPHEPSVQAPLPAAVSTAPQAATTGSASGGPLRQHVADELTVWLKTLASAALYATLIVTFVFQVARVEGRSMAPTLEDQDRLIINKFAYRIDAPHLGDIVMLYYPNDPSKSFVKRLIAGEGDQVRIVAGKVYRNGVLL